MVGAGINSRVVRAELGSAQANQLLSRANREGITVQELLNGLIQSYYKETGGLKEPSIFILNRRKLTSTFLYNYNAKVSFRISIREHSMLSGLSKSLYCSTGQMLRLIILLTVYPYFFTKEHKVVQEKIEA